MKWCDLLGQFPSSIGFIALLTINPNGGNARKLPLNHDIATIFNFPSKKAFKPIDLKAL
jgi:hypothetical protein